MIYIEQQLEQFTAAYIEAIYFTDTGDDGLPPTDTTMAGSSVMTINQDCERFLMMCPPLTNEQLIQAGHDFWLTRNGHGAGFWDGDWSEELEHALMEVCEGFHEVWSYQGDDGLMYVEG